jgi:integrase
MQRERLTLERIRRFSLPAGKAQAYLWDTEAPRLAVRATNGAKSFIFEAKLNRQTIRVTLGDVDAWPLNSIWSGKGADRKEVQRGAREEANRLAALVNQGIDPRAEKAEQIVANENKQTEAKRKTATVADAWQTYMDERRPHWGERYYRDHLSFARQGGEQKKRGPGKTNSGPLAPLLALKLADLTQDRVRGWLQSEAAIRPTQARQAYGALRTFLQWCEDRPQYRGLANTEAATARTGRQELPKKAAKDDVLQREQLSAWFTAVRQLPNPILSAYLQGLLLTGARREELANLTWDNLDFRWQSLTIRDKVEGERTIPLTPYVASLLNALPRRNKWVFSSTAAASGRLQEPRRGHIRAIKAAGLPPLTIHGLRRSFGTLAEWTETPTGVVAQIMGHKPSATAEKHYRRRPLDLLRLWHVKLEAWILNEAGIPQPQEPAEGLRLVKA